MKCALSFGEIHVWYVRFQMVPRETLIEYSSIISADETRQMRSYIFEKDRDAYLISHVLVRSVLSFYWHLNPQDWIFRTNSFGKPEIATPDKAASLRFNLSHTNGLAAVAVTIGSEVGVDVENLNRKNLNLDVARTVFAPLEIRYLETVPPSELTQALFEMWTLKEAYIKALGVGFSMPLQNFAFGLNPPRLVLPETEIGKQSHWRFALYQPAGNYILAVAGLVEDGKDLRVKVREIIP